MTKNYSELSLSKIRIRRMVSEKPRILFIIHLPPPVHGAGKIGQYIYESIPVNNSFECFFINLSTSDHLSEIGKQGIKKTMLILKLYLKVLKEIFIRRYDYCYMTINSKGAGFYKDMIIVLILKILKYKMIYHYHNKGIANVKKNWLNDKLYRIQFKNSRTILLSKLLYGDIEKYVPEEMVYYCSNGIPQGENVDIELLNSLRSQKNVPELLFLSNMIREKGVFTLLEACKLLNLRGVMFRAVFIGAWSDIKEEDFMDYIVKNNLANYVTYAGKKYDDEKSSYFSNADIFVFPTFYTYETFGLVNLEAMLYGLPVITTDEGAISEVVEDNCNGFIVPKEDPQALADKIEFLIKNPSLRIEMGKKGRKRFEEKYTLKIFENNFVQIIKEIISNFSLRSAE